MRYYSLLILVLSLLFYSCSSVKNTETLSAEERLNLAKAKFEDKDYDDALLDFQALLLQFAGTTVVDDAQFYIGMCRFKKKEYILSAFEFSKLIKDYPTSEYVKDSQFMLANSYFELSPHYSLDQKYTNKAIEEFQAFIDFFPTDPRVPEAEEKIKELNDKLAEKIFNTAKIYLKMENWKSALYYFDQLLEKYPDSKFSEETLYMKIQTLNNRGRKKEMIESVEKFRQKYPNSTYLKEITNLLAQLPQENTSK